MIVSQRKDDFYLMTAIGAEFALDNMTEGFMIFIARCTLECSGNPYSQFLA